MTVIEPDYRFLRAKLMQKGQTAKEWHCEGMARNGKVMVKKFVRYKYYAYLCTR